MNEYGNERQEFWSRDISADQKMYLDSMAELIAYKRSGYKSTKDVVLRMEPFQKIYVANKVDEIRAGLRGQILWEIKKCGNKNLTDGVTVFAGGALFGLGAVGCIAGQWQVGTAITLASGLAPVVGAIMDWRNKKKWVDALRYFDL